MNYSNVKHSIQAKDTRRLQNLFNESICPMEHVIWTDNSSPSVTSYKQVCLSGIDVILDKGTGFREAIRNHHHIVDDPCDDFIVSLPLDAQVRFNQSGTKSFFSKGEFTLLSTARPFTASVSAVGNDVKFSHIIARLSGPLLRQKIPYVDILCGTAIEIRPGIGNIMHSLINLALDEGDSLTEPQSRHFSNTLIETIADAILSAPKTNLPQLGTKGLAKSRLIERAKCFILANLSNPELNAALIANECKVSVRYLRAAFEPCRHTVNTFIRQARLQQCNKTLANPLMIHKSIIDIAMSWGFNDPSYFSRTYRAHFNESPRDTRNNALNMQENNYLY